MKLRKYVLPITLLAIMMLFAFSATAFADDYEIPPYPQIPAEEVTTMEYVASYLLQSAGLKESQLGVYPRDHISMAKSVGLLEGVDFVQGEECSFDDYMKMALNLRPLYEAMNAKPMKPFFVNGSAQPIFDMNDIIRFVVYIESNFDTDEDGKLDLIKTVIQIPKQALEGMKAAVVYEAIPYTAGTNSGNNAPYEAAAGATYDINRIYATPPARVPVGEITTAEHYPDAKSSDWTYYYGANATGNANCFNNMNSYNYYLVRGFAVVLSAGRGTAQSEGISTCGSDVEIDGYKVVIDWLNGNAKAYTNKTDNIEIKADWTNGNVGMTGTSYGGTTQFGLATTGVEGLKAIVPVAGIASWYEYSNQQGTHNNTSLPYTQYLAWYVDSRYRNLAPFGDTSTTDHENTIQEFYGRYLRQLRDDQDRNTGDYFDPHWSSRDYTNTEYGYYNWANIKTPALIVHGTNDRNVRTKQSDLMYQAYTKAGATVKMIWHQGVHITPNTLQPGEYTYREILNRWWSHYLYDVDNGIENMPNVTVTNNVDGSWDTYDSWSTDQYMTMKASYSTKEHTSTVNSAYNTHSPAISSNNFRNYFLAGDTPHSAIYTMKMTEDMFIKGAVAVNVRAAVDNFVPPPAPAIRSFVYEEPEIGEWDAYLTNGVINWDAVDAGLESGDIDHNTVMMLMRDYKVYEEEPVPAISSFLPAVAAFDAISRQDNLILSAMLVEISDEPFDTYSSSSTSYTTIESGGIWFGGGLSNANLQRITPVAATRNTIDNTYYKEFAYGWMDMANPKAKYDSFTAHRKDRVDLVPGEYYDFTLYLQPTAHTVVAGRTLALVIFAQYPGQGAGQPSAAQGQYMFTIDNSLTHAYIPVEKIPTTVEVNFPGVEDVTVQYYSAADSWVSLPGTYTDTCSFLPPEGVVITSVRAVKAGMSYTFNNLTVGYWPVALDVPVETITVTGIDGECNLGLVQTDWVYSSAPAVVGEDKEFAVFANGLTYELRLTKNGFYPINKAGLDAGATVDFGADYFYTVTVPAGVLNVRMQSNGWIYPMPANEGIVLSLLRDYGNEKTATMTYGYKGVNYDVTFLLDGTDPFGIAAYDEAFAVFCSYYDTSNWTFLKSLLSDDYTTSSILKAESIMGAAGSEHAALLSQYGKLAVGRFELGDDAAAIDKGTQILRQGVADMFAALIGVETNEEAIAAYDEAHAAYCSYYDTATWTFKRELFLGSTYGSILEAEKIMNAAGSEHADFLAAYGKLAAGRFDKYDDLEVIEEGTRILNDAIEAMLAILE